MARSMRTMRPELDPPVLAELSPSMIDTLSEAERFAIAGVYVGLHACGKPDIAILLHQRHTDDKDQRLFNNPTLPVFPVTTSDSHAK